MTVSSNFLSQNWQKTGGIGELDSHCLQLCQQCANQKPTSSFKNKDTNISENNQKTEINTHSCEKKISRLVDMRERKMREARVKSNQNAWYTYMDLSKYKFYFSKRKCNVRCTGWLTNTECLETCNWILGPSINHLRRQKKCKRKSRDIGKKTVPDKFHNFSLQILLNVF